MVVVLGTRYYFSTCSVGEPSQLSQPKNVVSTHCMPPIRQLITSLDESREQLLHNNQDHNFYNLAMREMAAQNTPHKGQMGGEMDEH